MNVTHVMLSLDVGGLERNVLNQVRQAPRLGQRVSIICLERRGALADQVESLGSPVLCLNKQPGIRPGLIPQLRRAFEQLQTQVAHTHQIATLFYAGPAARLAQVPVVVHTEHGKERYAQRRRTRLLGRAAGLFADTFFCLTHDMAAAVADARVVPAGKLRVIANGIDTAQFLQSCDTAAARAQLDLPAEARVIGTVGRLTEVKRQDVLIKALARIRAAVPAAHLVLVGEGPLRSQLQSLADSLGVSPWVRFAGYQSPTTPFIQLMDIFALTSRSEGMPQAAIEASVCGVPVVASRVGGLPELIEDNVTGVLTPVGDDAAVAQAILDLLRDPARARRLGAAARQRAVERFDIARMANDYHQHFLQLFARGGTACPGDGPGSERRLAGGDRGTATTGLTSPG